MYLILIAVVLAIVWKLFKQLKLSSKLRDMPGPKGYPVIGSTLDYCYLPIEKNFNLSRLRSVKYYPGPWQLWLGMSPMVYIYKAEHVEIVLRSLVHSSNKGGTYRFLLPWLGNSLLTAPGPRWRVHRKMLTPTFHFKILQDFTPVFIDKSKILIDRLRVKADSEPIDILPYLSQCALDIICETAMGVSINAQSDHKSEYVKAIYEVTDLALKRSYTPWLHSELVWRLTADGRNEKKCLEILHGFTNQVIQDRKKTRAERANKTEVTPLVDDDGLGRKKTMPFLDLILEATKNGQPLTDEEIREETDTFLFGGHDTTAVNMSWVLFLLGNYPEIQERVFRELDSIFEGSDRTVTTEDLPKMKYLEMVIKESLRLYPSAPRISRVLEEDIKLGTHTVPKGVLAIIHIYQLHRDPASFPNPDQFNPDNFLPDNIAKRHPYSFVPFSAGPRNCIGQKFAMLEEKVVLSTILRNFKVKSIERESEVDLVASLILLPQNGTKVTLHSRK